VTILLLAISNYSSTNYWWLLMVILLMAIVDYIIVSHWWLFLIILSYITTIGGYLLS